MTTGTPANYYVIRPDNTALWIPADVMHAIGVRAGEKLTPEQMTHPVLQGLLEQRRPANVQKVRR